MKKRVFRTALYIKSRGQEAYDHNIRNGFTWMNYCDGKTEDETLYLFYDRWCEIIDDGKEET